MKTGAVLGAVPFFSTRAVPGFAIHQTKGLNDGTYGNDNFRIGSGPESSFTIDLILD